MALFASRFIRSLVVLLGLLLAATAVAHAKSPGYPEWRRPPTCIFAMPYLGHAVKPGETGIILEILKAIFRDEGIKLEHRNIPYKRVLEELRAGTVSCTLDVKHDKRRGLQSKSTIATYDLAVAYRVRDGFKGVEDMAGQRVAYLHGFELRSLLPVEVKPDLAYDLTSAVRMLDLGTVKYVIDDKRMIKDAILEAKLPTSEFGIFLINSLEVHLLFADTEEGRMFRDVCDRRIVELIRKGQLQELLLENGLSQAGVDEILKANGFKP